ncbi:MAG: MepB family protein [Coxiellaceae bacterium]|nr:MepB family protein [Coxiellaceae bacterium]
MNNHNAWDFDSHIHKDLVATKKFIYDPCKMIISTPVTEPESAKYGAFAFTLNGFNVRFRVAKITPTKIGQFVTLWKRSASGPIQPFDASDPVYFFGRP